MVSALVCDINAVSRRVVVGNQSVRWTRETTDCGIAVVMIEVRVCSVKETEHSSVGRSDDCKGGCRRPTPAVSAVQSAVSAVRRAAPTVQFAMSGL